MTIQELYIFACKNDIYDKDVYEVISKYNKLNTLISAPSSLNSSIVIDDISEMPVVTLFDKLEWSTTDVLELFSI